MARLALEADWQADAGPGAATALMRVLPWPVRSGAAPESDVVRLIALTLLGTFVATALVHVAGAGIDVAAAIRNPLELNYGEGIVWQQAALIPGPRMYAQGAGLPFVVFHYPPLFYLLVRAALPFMPDFLAAGRLVAGLSTMLFVPLVSGLVLIATPRRHRFAAATLACAAGAALFAVSLGPVRGWSLVMRVDMPGIAFGLAGLLVAARADGRFWGTSAALLLCLAAVFTKQTLLSPGLAVFLVALARRPRQALAAGALVGACGAAIAAWLQGVTDGGFLHHLLGNNINRFSAEPMLNVLYRNANCVLVPPGFMLCAAWLVRVIHRTLRASTSLGPVEALRHADPITALRHADPITARRVLLLLHFLLSTLSLALLLKKGAWSNYCVEWLCSGSVLLGLGLTALSQSGSSATAFAGGLTALILTLHLSQVRQLPFDPDPALLALNQQLIGRIRQAPRPVASENMVLLMRAGQGVIYEPAIVTELAHLERWDEAPLVDMIRGHGFEFMLTSNGLNTPGDRRTPAVNDAMQQAYPRVRQLAPGLWLHEAP